MKIVFTVATYYPKTDGVQFVTKYHAEGLAKQGHKVIVFTSYIEGQLREETINGVLIKRVDAFNYYYWHKGNKKRYQEFVIQETLEADALIAVCLQSFAADWLLDVLDEINCKKILYLHGMPDFKLHIKDCNSIKNIAKTLFRNLWWGIFYRKNLSKIKKFNAIIHLYKNDNSYKYFLSHNYDKNYVIENACDDIFFREVKLRNEKQYFLYVGNYCERKNQELILEAFYRANTQKISLILIGSTANGYYKKLQKINNNLRKKYGEKDVEILYSIPRSLISDYTKKAYVCVMSSRYEYYPITIIEALAAAVPFISTDVGIVRYLPGGVIANNLEDMIYWMEFMVKNYEYKKNLGLIGKKYALENLMIASKVAALEKIILKK